MAPTPPGPLSALSNKFPPDSSTTPKNGFSIEVELVLVKVVIIPNIPAGPFGTGVVLEEVTNGATETKSLTISTPTKQSSLGNARPFFGSVIRTVDAFRRASIWAGAHSYPRINEQSGTTRRVRTCEARSGPACDSISQPRRCDTNPGRH